MTKQEWEDAIDKAESVIDFCSSCVTLAETELANAEDALYEAVRERDEMYFREYDEEDNG